MKIAIWIGFIVIFVWIISVLVSIVSPTTVFGPINIITSVLTAVTLLAIVEVIWGN